MALVQLNIEKLNAHNYGNWSSDVKYLLLEKNCWDIVTGNETAPATEQTVELKDFNARSRTALAVIYLNVSPEFRQVIENIDEPREAWNKLQTHFYPDNRARHMQLFSDVLACRLQVGESVDVFASRIQRLASQLSAIKQQIPETYLTFQLLRYLPPQYDSLVQSILRWSDEKFIFKDVLTELVAEESRLLLRENDRAQEISAELTNTKFHRTSKPICFRCKQPGHFKKQCRARFTSKSAIQTSCSSTSRDSSPSRSRPSLKDSDRRDTRRGASKPRRTVTQRTQSIKPEVHFLIQTNLNKVKGNGDAWVFDTAASHHFCKDKSLFTEFTPLKNESMAVAIDDIKFPIEGKGMVDLKFGDKIVTFGDVMYSPRLRRNLISGSRLDSRGSSFKGGEGSVKAINRHGETLFNAKLKSGIYYIYPEIPKKKSVKFQASTIQKDEMKIWHRRFGHVSPGLIENTYKSNSVRGLPCVRGKDFHCEICKLNKHKRVSFKPTKNVRSEHPLDLLHTDIWGPTKEPGSRGERYFLLIVDDFSRKSSVYPIKHKSEAFEVFKRHVTRAETFLGRKLKAVRSDNGREFTNEQFDRYFEEKGVQREFTNVYTPEQNGVAERFNQTIANGARSILNDSNLSVKFWPEAVLYFVYTWNRVCHSGQTSTPFELYGGRKPSVKHLKPFGSVAYVGVPKQLRTKFDPKARKGILVGYAMTTKGYRVWLPEQSKVIETINVAFNEDATGTQKRNGDMLDPDFFFYPPKSEIDPESVINPEVPQSLSFPNAKPAKFNKQTRHEVPQVSDSDSDEEGKTPMREAVWLRKVVPRKTGWKTDIYFYEQGKSQRLRSLRDVRDYCTRNDIKFKAYLFNFKNTDKYEGIVSGDTGSSSSKSSPIIETDEYTGQIKDSHSDIEASHFSS